MTIVVDSIFYIFNNLKGKGGIIVKGFSYHDKVNIENSTKLRELIVGLPRFSKDFFRGIEPTTSSNTRIAYAYDLGVFFEFLSVTNLSLRGIEISDYKIDILEKISPVDIEEYLEYLSYYEDKDIHRINSASGKKRKLTSLRSFYNYFYKREQITKNPSILVDLPRIQEKEIIKLEIDEIALLLDAIEEGTNITKGQKRYHDKTKLRDLALVTLLLGTGIRVSECVGLDINDVDFELNGIKITRKGGNEVVIYFGDEVCVALINYMEERKNLITKEGHENALFLSLQMRRMSVRSIENMVKKYASTVTKLKNITPHKLRSTYGTRLYQETGDIYLVADVLGHSDVNTTKRHYAAIEDNRRRSVANMVKLRDS